LTTRICIVGIGAIGGCVAGALSTLPEVELTAVARGATLDSLKRRGLTVADNDAVRHVEFEATDHPATLGRQDVLIIATKGQALPKLAPELAPLVDRNTVILPLLNGVPWWYFAHLDGPAAGFQPASVDPEGVVSRHLPPAQVIGAVVHFSASSPLPATVSRGKGNQMIIGDPDGGRPDAVALARRLLSAAGFDVEVSSRIHRDVWYKLWGNLCLNPVSALTRATVDAIAADPDARALCTRVMAEAAAVSERFGIGIDASADDRIAVAGKLGRFKTSMLQDAESGRRLEIAPLLGAVCEIADHLGVAVPYTRSLLGLARLLDQSLVNRR
jgi:2-dehydropantoate 2-reductase